MDGLKKITNIDEMERARQELMLLYEISNAMRTTLELDQILYIILTACTSHEGLGFNRAMLFLVNDKGSEIEGKMGIGPHSGEEANLIWKGIESQRLSLEDLINAYDNFRQDPNTKLHNLVRTIHLPLSEDSGIIPLTALEGMPFEVTTDEIKKKIWDGTLDYLGTDHFVTVPLKAKDKVLGVILADNIFNKKPITKNDVRILTLFANHAGLAIENSRLYEEKVFLSNTDWLTKLWNHGYFQTILTKEIAIAEEEKMHLSLMLIDIDDFKNYNDKCGHVAGDEIIRGIAKVLKDASRKKDYVSRYGGEEYAIILPHTSKDEAYMIGERLRIKVEEFKFPHIEVQPQGKMTISIGICTFPESTKDKNDLILKADKALYKAKTLGKNKTLLYNNNI